MKKLIKQRTKGIICFDLDGTIITSKQAHVLAYQKAFKDNGLKAISSKKLISHFGEGIEKLIKNIFPTISYRKRNKIIKDHAESLKKYIQYIKQIPGAMDAVFELKKKYKIAVVSNNHREDIIELMELAGVDSMIFDEIIGENEVKHPKPAPDEIKLAKKLLKLKPLYMVGDTIYDIRAGKAAKVKTIAVLTGVHSIEKLMAENPDIIIQSIAFLPDALR